jgi:hypothetical protein
MDSDKTRRARGVSELTAGLPAGTEKLEGRGSPLADGHRFAACALPHASGELASCSTGLREVVTVLSSLQSPISPSVTGVLPGRFVALSGPQMSSGGLLCPACCTGPTASIMAR